jgi:hypothetical protein
MRTRRYRDSTELKIRSRRCSRRHVQGCHAGSDARTGWVDASRRHRRSTRRYTSRGPDRLDRTLEQMLEQVEMLERRLNRTQRMATMQSALPQERADDDSADRINTRSRRPANSPRRRYGRRFRVNGRKMGRMAHRMWRDRHMDA